MVGPRPHLTDALRLTKRLRPVDQQAKLAELIAPGTVPSHRLVRRRSSCAGSSMSGYAAWRREARTAQLGWTPSSPACGRWGREASADDSPAP